MGLGASRELEKQLHAVNNASNPILIFEDPETLKLLTTIWKEVPNKYKSELTQTRSRTVDKSSKAQSKSTITLHSSIKEEYQLWKTDPSTIICHVTARQVDFLPKNPVFNTYPLLTTLEKGTIIHSILHRFLCIKLYRLKAAFNSKSLRGERRADFLALVLNSSLTEDQKMDVHGKVDRWTRAGKKYLAIAEGLEGTGSLLLLPADVSVSVWEKFLPSKGAEFNEMMKCLKDRGICKEANKIRANEVAAGIEKMIMGEWTTCEYRPQGRAVARSENLIPEAPIISPIGHDSTQTGSSRNSNSNSINALLNAADYITKSTQGQQLPTIGYSSTQVDSTARPRDHEQDSTVGEQGKIRSRQDARDLETTAEGNGPPSKRRRVGTFTNHDSPLSQSTNGLGVRDPSVPLNGVTHQQHRVSASHTLGGTGFNRVSQASDTPYVETMSTNLAVMADINKLNLAAARLLISADVDRGTHTTLQIISIEMRLMREVDGSKW